MFVDFDKVFNNTPQTDLKIPQALADQLSSNLQDGLVYEIDSKTNTLFISPDGNEDSKLTINGMLLEPTKEQKELLGESFSIDDIMKLSYNSQQPIPIRFNDNKNVNINGEEIPIEMLEYNPFKPDNLWINSAYIFPEEFPEAFSLSIGCDSISIDLSIKRIPNNSLTTMAFESDQNKCLILKYFYDPTNNNLSMTLNISIDKSKSVKEIVEAIEIYNAFIDGKGRLSNSLIKTHLNTANATKYDEKALLFWKKVLKLEEKLNVHFDPNCVDLTYENVCDIEETYQSIINTNPIRHHSNINSIESKWKKYKDQIVADSLGKPLYFEFNCTNVVELFGQKIKLPCIVGLFNAVLSKYEKDEEKEECTIFLENESEEKKMYTSTLSFITEKELLKYKEKNQNIIPIFKNAKEIHEYLNQ